MAHQEQNGSGRNAEAGPVPEGEERVGPGRPAEGPEESEEAGAGAPPDPAAPAPSPREQWFGGFEGAAPPPPPYARMPEDTPFPVPGTAYQGTGHQDPPEDGGDEGAGGDADAGGEPGPGPSRPSVVPEPSELPGLSEPFGSVETSEERELPEVSELPEVPDALEVPETSGASAADEGSEDSDDAEDEMRGSTVRLLPGSSRGRPQRQWLQRPARPGGEPDPLSPRGPRHDSDVPEPEQLPPLEPDRGGLPGREDRKGAGTDAAAPDPGSGAGTEPGPGSGPPPVAGTVPGTRTSGGPPEPDGPFPPGPTGAPRSRPEPPPTLTGPRAGLTPPARPAAPSEAESPASPSAGPPDRWRGGREQETSDSLNAATLVRNRRQGPSGGWRRAVHAATLGLVNPGESAKVLRRRELVARACTPVATGHHRVAVLSLKGGVGKTTTTVALGATLASLRGDRVLAVDANPDRGTLSDKVRLETAATIRDLLNERHLVSRYADIRGFTSQAPSRLEILASDRDPAVSEAFSDSDYREVARIVEHFYSICITDCGTGLLHSAMRGVLGLADQVVLVSSASVDGARSASATLDWLEAHGHGALVRSAVVVLSMVRSDSKSSVDLNRLQEHFAGRCRDVVRVPWDGHLEEGAEVDLEQLAPATRDSYLQLAASVGEAFAWRR
ncbi:MULTISPECIES: MinD/ParA family protein [unclassified Nocardiopsis]|uniref:MinD/ParA family ATP-binding protein n=1 Tax=unclassified Nocardiopsis TaxID=2649073 RepID=UPI00093EE43A|nr:MinD/ParA family protein [Nocardiopsis sp. TSRI0078]